jgi:hypothetical protein
VKKVMESWLNDGKDDRKNDGGGCENEISPNNMYACPQLNTCHVGSYFGPLVPNFRT